MATFDRLHPFQAKILSRYRLNRSEDLRETWHFVLSIEGSEIQYQPGDSFAIYPENDPSQVDRIIKAIQLPASHEVKDAKGGVYTLKEFLSKKANIAHTPKKFLVALASRSSNEELHKLLQDDDAVKHYTSTHNLVEIVEAHPHVQWEAEPFILALQPMLPRFYSIASSQLAHPHQVDFTVARVHYDISGRERRGVCSHFLCDMAALHTSPIPMYLQPSKDFHLPQDDTKNIIMVGPGTGVAPFRGFMQERVLREARGKNWLFFGERHEKIDFFYEEYWRKLAAQGKLRLDTAFSRDQEQKIYVQHRMWENKADFWKWLEEGALLYVCGSADKMAKDVDKCLHDIIETEGGLSPEAAREFVKKLRHEKRYLRDIY
jgi:sulfite reductase (NADPH) flavoprotein alpha-component